MYAIGAAVMVILTINPGCDLALSERIINHSSVFGIIFELFGYWPTMLPLLLASAFMLFYRKKWSLPVYIITGTLSVIGVIIGAAYIGAIPVLFFVDHFKVGSNIFAIPAVLIAAGLSLLLAKKIRPENRDALRSCSFIVVLYTLAAELVAYGVKIPWGRARPQELELGGVFTPWFIPQGVTGSQSFPSGHVLESTGILLIIFLLCWYSEKVRRYQLPLYLLSIGFILCVAISRILVGAHFASDVTMGALLGISVNLIAVIIWKRKIAV